MVTASLSSYAGAVTLRFFLGLIESSVSPGFVLGAFLVFLVTFDVPAYMGYSDHFVVSAI
jgi:hypothetical protein